MADDELPEPPDEEFLREDELHDRWKGKVAIATLANWRRQGKGPPYHKLEGGQVLYLLEDIEAYERSQRVMPNPDLPRGSAPSRRELERDRLTGFGEPGGPT